MNKGILLQLVSKNKSIREIASELKTSPTNIRYWLKKFSLATIPKPHVPPKCACGETDPKKFYGKKKRICGKCHNQYTLAAGQRKRKKAVALFGGQCCYCKYNRCIQSLNFHHTDPKRKDPNFRSMRGWSWERIVEELKQCILVCRNCHGEIHAGMRPI